MGRSSRTILSGFSNGTTTADVVVVGGEAEDDDDADMAVLTTRRGDLTRELVPARACVNACGRDRARDGANADVGANNRREIRDRPTFMVAKRKEKSKGWGSLA